MRRRLAVILYVPLLLVLVVLGSAYVVSVARADQQSVYLDRLSDTGYLVITARQSLVADDPGIVTGDLARYRDVYGIDAAVVDVDGATWATNGLAVQDVDERLVALAGRRAEESTSLLPWRMDRVVVAEPVFDGGDLVGAVVTVSDADELSRATWLSWGALAAAGVLVCLLALVVAHRTAGWALRPVAAVDRAMAQIGEGRLDARIPPSTGPPELRAVVARFNEMAARVEHLVLRQQEFVSNASHELRNPLNALMLRIEALSMSVEDMHDGAVQPGTVEPGVVGPGTETEPGLEDEVAHVRSEAQRMRHILDALLLLADGAEASAGAVPTDVGDLVTRRTESWQTLAPDRPVLLDLPDEPQWALVAGTALESAVDAVMDNATKYAPPGSPVHVSVTGVGTDRVQVVVRDHGPGVRPDELDQLSERFWRSPGHSRVHGSGLGLSIASELLAGGDGSLRLELPPGGGLQARIEVPRLAPAPSGRSDA